MLFIQRKTILKSFIPSFQGIQGSDAKFLTNNFNIYLCICEFCEYNINITTYPFTIFFYKQWELWAYSYTLFTANR